MTMVMMNMGCQTHRKNTIPLLVTLCLLVHIADCASPGNFVYLTPQGSPESFLMVGATFGDEFPSSGHWNGTLHLMEPKFGCSSESGGIEGLSVLPNLPQDGEQMTAFGIIAYRGVCRFDEKARNARVLGAQLVIIVNSEDSELLPEGANVTGAMVAGMPRSTGEQVAELVRAGSTEKGDHLLYATVELAGEAAGLDPVTTTIIFLIAVSTMWGASYWSAQPLPATTNDTGTSFRQSNPLIDEEGREEILYVGKGGALCFVCFASVGLILMFFFMDKLFYVILVMYCIAGASSVTRCANAVVRRCKHNLARVKLPVFGETTYVAIALSLISIMLSAIWFVNRKNNGAWVYQDIMGVCIVLIILRTVRLPNLRISSMLMCMAFLYDIFWVFISPHIFQDSVMVHVATGGDQGEALPMLIKVPKYPFYDSSYSMLGLGDIALPALHVSLCLRYDILCHRSAWKGYFALNVVGYAFGLLATFLSLVLMEKGQPALLYLVPFTLGITFLVALKRRDFTALMNLLPNGQVEEQEVALRRKDNVVLSM